MSHTPENPEDAALLRAANAWQEEGFAVWEAVAKQIASETPAPNQFAARTLSHALYTSTAGNEVSGQYDFKNLPVSNIVAALPEASGAPEPPSEMALLLAEVRACRKEMGELRAEVASLRREIAATKSTGLTHGLLPFAPPLPPLQLS